MKKQAQPATMPAAPLAGIPNIYMKRQELQKAINDSLTQFKTVLDTTQKQITEQATRQLTDITQKLNAFVEKKLNEMQRLIPQQTTQTTQNTPTAAFDLPGVVKTGKKKQKHPTPRDSEHNKNLPDFWRKNYDYGESPYMNLEKIDKITDKPPYKKKKKKSQLIKDLLKFANQLDEIGLHRDASAIDMMVRELLVVTKDL